MTAYDPEDQSERRRVLENDRRVRDQSTYADHARSVVDDKGGRFAKLNVTPTVHRLPESSPWSGSQPGLGIEPPLGYSIDQLEPQSGAPDSAPVETTDDRDGSDTQRLPSRLFQRSERWPNPWHNIRAIIMND